MISKKYCQTMAQYNSKMNDRLYDVCGLLSEAERTKDVGLFFSSIHKTLEHLLYSDMAWLYRFTGSESEIPNMDQVVYPDYSELREVRLAWDEKMIKWSTSVEDEWLRSDFSFISNVDGQKRTRDLWLLVSHMFNHSTHHRGQLTTVLTQQGIDFGITDLAFLIGETEL